jgi:hypothetical protein
MLNRPQSHMLLKVDGIEKKMKPTSTKFIYELWNSFNDIAVYISG